jgi:hypothetical protein
MKQTLVDGERSRTLAILAENPDGCTRAVMLGRGFPLALIASLIRAGLATDQIAKRIHGGPRAAAPVRITDAGRQALAEASAGAALVARRRTARPAPWPMASTRPRRRSGRDLLKETLYGILLSPKISHVQADRRRCRSAGNRGEVICLQASAALANPILYRQGRKLVGDRVVRLL